MNLYGGPIDRYFEEGKSRRYSEPAADFYPDHYNFRRPDSGEALLSKEQILELREKYNLLYMTCEEEETLLDDLNKMGVLTNEDCGCYTITGGNIYESVNRQVSSNINLLYRMAIAGKYCNRHVEHIRSQQKLLNVLEQLTVE